MPGCAVAGARYRPLHAAENSSKQQAHAIDQKTGAGGAGGRKVILEILDVIFGLSARAIDVFVQRAGIESRQRRHPRPRARLVDKFIEQAHRARHHILGLRCHPAIAGAKLCWLSHRAELGVAGETENEVGVWHAVDQAHQLRSAEVAVAPNENMGIGKMAANQFQNAPHDHRIFLAKRPLVGPQHGRDQGARPPIENHQRQVAGRIIVVVVERRRLLAVTRIFGVIQVDNEVLGRAGEAGNELQGEGLADAVDILAPRVRSAKSSPPMPALR